MHSLPANSWAEAFFPREINTMKNLRRFTSSRFSFDKNSNSFHIPLHRNLEILQQKAPAAVCISLVDESSWTWNFRIFFNHFRELWDVSLAYRDWRHLKNKQEKLFSPEEDGCKAVSFQVRVLYCGGKAIPCTCIHLFTSKSVQTVQFITRKMN